MSLPIFWDIIWQKATVIWWLILYNPTKLRGVMSLKEHVLDSHLDIFPQNLGAVSDEHRQRFHQDIYTMEKQYKGKWSPSMLADYC